MVSYMDNYTFSLLYKQGHTEERNRHTDKTHKETFGQNDREEKWQIH
jgi:hypothetical protein